MADFLLALAWGEQQQELLQRLQDQEPEAGPERPLIEWRNPFHLYTDRMFIYRYRFTKETAQFLIDELTPALEGQRPDGLPVYVKVLTALRFYAVGSFQILHGDDAGISQPTLSRIIANVSTQIARWRPRYIHFPNTAEDVNRTQEEFFEYCQFPGVIGAIDCTHVGIRCPGGVNGQRFLNRKGTYSINVQAVCDHHGLFTNLVARWAGGTHDSRIFRESMLKEILERDAHEPKWLLGDSGYQCQPFLMTPLLHPVGRAQALYNRAQIKGRNIIERTFGMVKRRFASLNSLRLKLDTTLATIVAVGVLWNISRMRNEPDVEGLGEVEMPDDDLPPLGGYNHAGIHRRQMIIQTYFE